MSLLVGDAGNRGRSRSPAARDRSRNRVSESPSMLDAVRMPSPPAGFSYDDHAAPIRPSYNHNNSHDHRDSYLMASPADQSNYYGRSRESLNGYEQQRKSRGDVDIMDAAQNALRRGADTFLPAKYAAKVRESDSDREHNKQRSKQKIEEGLAYGSAASLPPAAMYPGPKSPAHAGDTFNYSMPGQWAYDTPDEQLTYSRADAPAPALPRRPSGSNVHRNSYGADPRFSGANVLTVEPNAGNRRARSPSSPMPPIGRMSSLSVNTGHHSASLSLQTGGMPPASPLLESYHGTYQSMSPMPSPLLLASHGGGLGDIIEPLSPGFSDGDEKKKRRARFTDPVDDAARLAQALKGERRAPETEPLIEILPGMTHEQVMELRAEYKRLVKTGSDRKGVNVAKHIRARLKDEDPTLMKACYATALGRWESEAYWANFWYQGDKTRRELLIESLMGRSNEEVRKIKDAFSDKKYKDSLVHCMKTELREDKFKKAVLVVLEERRMEDFDEYGRPLLVDRHLVEDDVEILYKAIRVEKGGETAMLQVVLLRSDAHLREVLKLYEKSCESNFARDALKKSGNLVGELLAHILNGIINKPVRDALLLHHALTASKKDALRRELLISRLVRYHWDRTHLAAVKRAYQERYGEDLREAVKEGTSGEWGLFCEQLVVTRMPDQVKRFDKDRKVEAVREEGREREGEREREERERDRAKERERETDREYERERERERERETHRDHEREREREKDRERERKKEKERERERERGRANSGGLLVVKDHKHRDRSKSRERSRSRRRD
ncbi:Uu.00g112510.m01.CDS01 [Anthostomella pinea]|uniref:Uu.00g112510.m01.CDS01 n=1 Tax=Anthostomella pinea TaxID=933095 RepID=A0AAI8YGL2_9PEZI|nr:Uu.00g112510.m01.CDS01 [Anthostomella pinea]